MDIKEFNDLIIANENGFYNQQVVNYLKENTKSDAFYIICRQLLELAKRVKITKDNNGTTGFYSDDDMKKFAKEFRVFKTKIKNIPDDDLFEMIKMCYRKTETEEERKQEKHFTKRGKDGYPENFTSQYEIAGWDGFKEYIIKILNT